MVRWHAEYFELKELSRLQTQSLSLWTLSYLHLLLAPLFPLKRIIENRILLQARSNTVELFFHKARHKTYTNHPIPLPLLPRKLSFQRDATQYPEGRMSCRETKKNLDT